MVERLILTAVLPLIENALLEAGVPEEAIEWRMKDKDPVLVDLTALWPRDNPVRNIYAWVSGRWPRFYLDVKGHFWEGDPNHPRQIIPFPFPSDQRGEPAAIITVSGSTSNPSIRVASIADITRLSYGLNSLAKTVNRRYAIYQVSAPRLQRPL